MAKITEEKDSLGNKVVVGDRVAYIAQSSPIDLKEGYITKLGPKMATICDTMDVKGPYAGTPRKYKWIVKLGVIDE